MNDGSRLVGIQRGHGTDLYALSECIGGSSKRSFTTEMKNDFALPYLHTAVQLIVTYMSMVHSISIGGPGLESIFGSETKLALHPFQIFRACLNR